MAGLTGLLLVVAMITEWSLIYSDAYRKENVLQHIAGNFGIQIPDILPAAVNAEKKLKDVQGVCTMAVTGETPLPNNHPATALLGFTANYINQKKPKIAGLTAASFKLRHVYNPATGDHKMYAMSPIGSALLDSINQHAELFETRSGSMTIFKNPTSAESTQQNFSLPPENLQVLDDPPLFAVIPQARRVATAPQTVSVMGLSAGLGVWMQATIWRNLVYTLYMLVAYMYMLHNPVSGFVVWCITVLPALMYSMNGREGQFGELFFLFTLYGWTLIVGVQYINGGWNYAYPYKFDLWNNTAAWQYDTSLTNLTQSGDAEYVVYYPFAAVCLYWIYSLFGLLPLKAAGVSAYDDGKDRQRSVDYVNNTTTKSETVPLL